MNVIKVLSALALGLMLFGTSTAEAQSALVANRTLFVVQGDGNDSLGVALNTSGDAAVALVNGMATGIQSGKTSVASVNLRNIDAIEIHGGDQAERIHLEPNFRGTGLFDAKPNLSI